MIMTPLERYKFRVNHICSKSGKRIPESCHVLNGRKQQCGNLVCVVNENEDWNQLCFE